jgi:hypothetical protein
VNLRHRHQREGDAQHDGQPTYVHFSYVRHVPVRPKSRATHRCFREAFAPRVTGMPRDDRDTLQADCCSGLNCEG